MKIVFITPHLSTGGLPQFLLKKIQVLKDTFDIYCIEWENITGGQLVVQRSQIENILKEKLITLGPNKSEVISILDGINPDVIHFEEFAETFIDGEILKEMVSKPYKITETTHGTLFNPKEKAIRADKTLFVSKGNVLQYVTDTNDFELIEYPTKNKEIRNYFLKELGLDPDKFHVLNVGLFNANKNQGEVFEYARQFGDHVQFHFVGNQAGNFESYWKPLMETKPSNVKVWGERNDTFKFYAFADLFLYTSKLENRPLSVLEAMSNNIPVLMYNLPNYGDDFVKENVYFLTDDFNKNLTILNNIIPRPLAKDFSVSNYDMITVDFSEPQGVIPPAGLSDVRLYHICTDLFAEREMKSIADLAKVEEVGIKYNLIVNEPYRELPPSENCAHPEKISMEPGGKLTPGHYGCYMAHRDAFLQGVKDNPDYIIICEADCGINGTTKEFLDEVNKGIYKIDDENALMYYLVYHNDRNIVEKKDGYSIVNGVIGAHCYLIPRKSYQFFVDLYNNKPWDVTDLFFLENLWGQKLLATNSLITKQYAGYSLLDKMIHENDRH
jgi:hypothetical protein